MEYFNLIQTEKTTKEILQNLQDKKVEILNLIRPISNVENLYNPVYKKFKEKEKDLHKQIKSLDWKTKLSTKIKEILTYKNDFSKCYEDVQKLFELVIHLIEKQNAFLKETFELLPFTLDSLFIVNLHVSLGLDVPEPLKHLLKDLDFKKLGYIPLNLSEPYIAEEVKPVFSEPKKNHVESVKDLKRLNHFNRGLTNTGALFKTVKSKPPKRERSKNTKVQPTVLEKRKERDETKVVNETKKVKKEEILAPESPERKVEYDEDDNFELPPSSPERIIKN